MTNPQKYENMDTQMRLLDASLLVPEMFLIERLNPAPPLVVCCLANYYFGYTTMYWCFLGPMLTCRLITLGFNIEFHPLDSPSVENGRVYNLERKTKNANSRWRQRGCDPGHGH
jgi:hypothetical protein